MPDPNADETNESTYPQASTGQGEAGGSALNDNQSGGEVPDKEHSTPAVGTIVQENSNERQADSFPIITSAINPIDNPQTLPPVVVGVEEKPDVKEPSLPVIGFNLSSIVLFIISGFILFLAMYLSLNQFEASSLIQIPTQTNISDSTYARKIELIRIIQEEKKSYRDFTMQMSQMVLLNLLLPVLTAILGYIFASNKNNNNT